MRSVSHVAGAVVAPVLSHWLSLAAAGAGYASLSECMHIIGGDERIDSPQAYFLLVFVEARAHGLMGSWASNLHRRRWYGSFHRTRADQSVYTDPSGQNRESSGGGFAFCGRAGDFPGGSPGRAGLLYAHKVVLEVYC